MFIVNNYCIIASCTYVGSVNLATRRKLIIVFRTGRITLFVVSPAPCTGLLGDSRLEVKTSLVKESLVGAILIPFFLTRWYTRMCYQCRHTLEVTHSVVGIRRDELCFSLL